MKKFKYSIGIKVTAFILMCCMAFVAVTGMLFGVIMWKAGFYNVSEEDMRTEVFSGMSEQYGHETIANYLISERNAYLDNNSLRENIEVEIVSGLEPYETSGVGEKDNLVGYEQVYYLGDFITPYETEYINQNIITPELETIIANVENEIAYQNGGVDGDIEESEDAELSHEAVEDASEEEWVEVTTTESYEIEENYAIFNEFIEYEISAIVYVDEEFGIMDELYFYDKAFDIGFMLKDALWLIISAAFLLAITCFVFLVRSAGFRKGYECPVVCGTARIPYDIYLLIVLSVGTPSVLIGMEWVIWGISYGSIVEVIAGIGALTIAGGVLTMFLLDLIVRYRTKTVFSNFISVKYWKKCYGWTKRNVLKLISIIPLIWKGIFVYAFIVLFSVPMIGFDSGASRMAVWLFINICVVPLFIYSYYMFRKMQLASKALGEGDLTYKVNTASCVFEFKEMGESLNSIAEAMEIAVEERMKSERMKTELISNVSHDIKTPLTSIVNYADLIRKEQTENPKIQEYSEILLRQADRLKRLTEDLVHASKVTSGNVEVQLVPCDIGVLLNQAVGEYEQKLKDAKLNVIVKLPKEAISIMADGRHLWRVFDNLLNNICKYAQEGTRVYCSVDRKGTSVTVEFKNISKYELNISEEELMERFVRGDKSRHSEGNGLGLSIAKSLVEVQGGRMNLSIDGDLFKVILMF